MTSAPRPRGIDYNLPTCGEIRCNGRGFCVLPPGGGLGFACECHLGYRGGSCQLTFNGSLSIPLTIGVVAALLCLVILAFVFAKLRQKQIQKRKEKERTLQQNQMKQVTCEVSPSQ